MYEVKEGGPSCKSLVVMTCATSLNCAFYQKDPDAIRPAKLDKDYEAYLRIIDDTGGEL